MKWIAVSNTKGGVGKSAVSLSLAHWLTQKGHTVAVVDDDRNRTVTKWQARADTNPPSQRPGFKVHPFEEMAQADGCDYGILDTAASVSDETIKHLTEFAYIVLIPCTPDIDALTATQETADQVIANDGSYVILLNDCPRSSKRENQDIADAITDGGYDLISQFVRHGIGIKRASLAGKTVEQMKGTQRLPWLDFHAAFQEFSETYLEA